MSESKNRNKLMSIIEKISKHVNRVLWISIGLIFFVYILQYIFTLIPFEGSTLSEKLPFIKDLLSFLNALLVGLFSACLVTLLLDISTYKEKLLTANTAEILDTLLRPEEIKSSEASSETLQHLARNAMRLSLNISEGSIRDKLLGVCMDEASDIASSPYAEVNVHRSYKHDSNNKKAIYIEEHMTYKFFSLSSKTLTQKVWRDLSSGLIDDSDDKYQTLKCMLVVRGGCQNDNLLKQCDKEIVVGCADNAIKRYFESPYPPVDIPPHCNDLEISLTRSFYIPINEQQSTFNWGYPLKRLTYTAHFEDDGTRFSSKIKNCSRCGGIKECDDCSKGIVEISGLDTNYLTIKTTDWVGSRMSLEIEWNFDKNNV